MNYLDLADYLLIAESVTGVDADALARLERVGLAESALAAPAMSFAGVEFYPDVIDKAAVLCSRLAKNHPLPDGNKRAAYVAMREFLLRNGLDFKIAIRRLDGRDGRAPRRERGIRARLRCLAQTERALGDQ